MINAAGLLNGSDAGFKAVHLIAPAALYAAMQPGAADFGNGDRRRADPVRRFPAGGGKSGDGAGVTVLPPGLVLADTTYGGSSFARGLAALPWVRPLIGDGGQRLNPVHPTDLAQVVDDLMQHPDSGEVLESVPFKGDRR